MHATQEPAFDAFLEKHKPTIWHAAKMVTLGAPHLDHRGCNMEDYVADLTVHAWKAAQTLLDKGGVDMTELDKYVRKAIYNGARSCQRKRMVAKRHAVINLRDPGPQADVDPHPRPDEVFEGRELACRFLGSLTDEEADWARHLARYQGNTSETARQVGGSNVKWWRRRQVLLAKLREHRA